MKYLIDSIIVNTHSRRATSIKYYIVCYSDNNYTESASLKFHHTEDSLHCLTGWISDTTHTAWVHMAKSALHYNTLYMLQGSKHKYRLTYRSKIFFWKHIKKLGAKTSCSMWQMSAASQT